MSKGFSRAVKLRDTLLADLALPNNTLIWNGDDSFAQSVEERMLEAKPFHMDKSASKFLLDSAAQLSAEDFYHSIAKVRLPFKELWLEIDASTPDGKHHGRLGAVIDYVEDGLRVFGAQLFKFPRNKSLSVIYSGTEVVFAADGTVSLSDTPYAYFQDAVTESDKERLTREKLRRDAPFDAETIRDREQNDLQTATKCVAMAMSLAGLHGRPELVEICEPTAPSKKVLKSFEHRGAKPPKFSLSTIKLGKAAAGQLKASLETADDADTVGGKRTAHWVRGHLFLARNGKLTWRKAHVRGVGKPIQTARKVTT